MIKVESENKALRKMKKIIIMTIVFSLICLTACSGEKQNEDVVVINDNDQSITTFGVIRCQNAEDIVVPFNTTVKKLLVHEGEEVVEGQSLIQIDISEYNRQIEKKQKEIDSLNLQSDNLKRSITSLEEELVITKGYIETGSSPEYKKLALSLEAAENDFTYASADLSDNYKLLYDYGEISWREYQEEVRAVETKEQNIKDIKLSMEALVLNYESEARTLQLSIDQNKNDLIALESDMSTAESDIQQLKDNLNSEFVRNGDIVCDINRAIVNGLKYIPGDTIIAGSTIANLMDVSSLYIEADIEEENISGVHVNSLVHIVPETDKTKFYTGKVSFISSLASQKNDETMVSIRISIDDIDEFLIPNANVKVKIYP